MSPGVLNHLLLPPAQSYGHLAFLGYIPVCRASLPACMEGWAPDWASCLRACYIKSMGQMVQWQTGLCYHAAQSYVTGVQGIFASLYGGLGTGLGGLFGGFLYHKHGAAAVFRWAFVAVAAAWVVCTMCRVLAR